MHVLIPATVGQLEGALTVPAKFPGEWAFVLCHPHPQFGGTMNTKGIFRAARALEALGMATLRFNFRGVGQSSGAYDEGRGEKDDVRCAIDFLAGRYPQARLGLLGFSFGSWVGLQVGAAAERIVQLIGMGVPLRVSDFSFLRDCTKPKLFLQGALDEFGPQKTIREWFETLTEPKRLVFIEESTHLFETKIPELQQAILDYFQSQYGLVPINRF